jgi:hypothetical protein
MSGAPDGLPATEPSEPSTRHEVVVRLAHVRDLFAPPALDEFGGSADVTSGIEGLVVELLAARPRSALRASIVVPAAERTPEVEPQLQEAIRRYCDLKLRDLEHERATLRHEGWSALVLSGPLLVLALVASVLVIHSGLPSDWRSILGDVVVVLAWVVLWYPLDTLLWYKRPLDDRIAVLRAMQRMDVVVRAEDPNPPGTGGPGVHAAPGPAPTPSMRTGAARDPSRRRRAVRPRWGDPSRSRRDA